MSVKETQHYQSNKSRHKTGGSFIVLQKRPPKRNGPIPQVRRLHGLLWSPPSPLPFPLLRLVQCMTVHVYYWYMHMYQYSVRYFHIYTRELSPSSRVSSYLLVLWMLLNLLAACGRWELGGLSGSPVTACRRGRQAFSFEAMYTIKQARVAGRLNSVLTPGALFQRLEPVIILRAVLVQ